MYSYSCAFKGFRRIVSSARHLEIEEREKKGHYPLRALYYTIVLSPFIEQHYYYVRYRPAAEWKTIIMIIIIPDADAARGRSAGFSYVLHTIIIFGSVSQWPGRTHNILYYTYIYSQRLYII